MMVDYTLQTSFLVILTQYYSKYCDKKGSGEVVKMKGSCQKFAVIKMNMQVSGDPATFRK